MSVQLLCSCCFLEIWLFSFCEVDLVAFGEGVVGDVVVWFFLLVGRRVA